MDLECEEDVKEMWRRNGRDIEWGRQCSWFSCGLPLVYGTLLTQTRGSELMLGRENPYEPCPCQICGHWFHYSVVELQRWCFFPDSSLWDRMTGCRVSTELQRWCCFLILLFGTEWQASGLALSCQCFLILLFGTEWQPLGLALSCQCFLILLFGMESQALGLALTYSWRGGMDMWGVLDTPWLSLIFGDKRRVMKTLKKLPKRYAVRTWLFFCSDHHWIWPCEVILILHFWLMIWDS